MDLRPPPPPPLAEDLSRLSLHLEGLAEEILALEQAISGPLEGPRMDEGAIRQVQRLDFVRQSLEDCALLVHLLGRVAQGQIDRGAVQHRLTLETTRALLICPKTAPTPKPLAQGEIDLF